MRARRTHYVQSGRGPVVPLGSGGGAVAGESLLLDTRTTGVTSQQILTAGQVYQVTVAGTYSVWNGSLSVGTPEANAMFSTTGGETRKSTEVGIDADTIFAHPLTSPVQVGHWTQLEFRTDTALGWHHLEPRGGPFTTPQAGHIYTFQVVGAGQPLGVRVNDTPLTDNYGALQVTLGKAGAPAPAPAPAPMPTPTPTPTPTPAPSPPPPSPVPSTDMTLFDGRAKQMSQLYSYETTPGDLTTLHHGQSPTIWDGLLFLDNDITLVPDDRYGKAYKCTVKIGDHAPHNVGAPATNGAAELSKRRPNELGKWDYFALACKVPGWTNVAGISFATIASVGYETLKGDQVGLGLIPHNGRLAWQVHQNSGHVDTTKGIDTPTVFYRAPLMDVTYGEWREFVIAVKWATDNTGALQVYSRVPPSGTWQRVWDRENEPTYLWGINHNYAPVTQDMSSTPDVLDKIGLYYNLSGAKGTETAYLSGLTRSTSLAAAQATLP